MPRVTAHIIDFGAADPGSALPLIIGISVIALVGFLAAEHHIVKHGRVTWSIIRRNVVVVIALALGATLAPSQAEGQDRQVPAGLPDLVSQPPYIWFDKLVADDDGSLTKVLAFDGFLYNIGDGVLDLSGNPQEENGVVQRYFDGEEWVEVGTPPVRYETTDGHNHFHLMAAAEYELWNEAQTAKVSDAAKVGFCLLDTEQITDDYDAFYDATQSSYCEESNPDATSLRMGITPGWIDTYDANTTLQWVDVTDHRPGWYWIGALMDPDNTIVESNEDNNGLVFSRNKFAVTGYAARSLPSQSAGTPITLKADAYGEVGDVVWSIVEGPSNGSLSVPLNVDFRDVELVYTPDDGFTGVDQFAYTARSLDSVFPREPVAATVDVDASGFSGDPAPALPIPMTDPPADIGLPDELQPSRFRRYELQLDGPDGGQWFATQLPPGLSIDRDTGVLSGVATRATPSEATITLVHDGEIATYPVPWSVASEARPSLDDVAPFTLPRGESTQRFVGGGTVDAEYTATGLPEGVRMVPNIPQIAGTPEASGVYEVEVIERLDDEVIGRTSFTWTVRPSAVPEFTL